jgi:hypothetical protein
VAARQRLVDEKEGWIVFFCFCPVFVLYCRDFAFASRTLALQHPLFVTNSSFPKMYMKKKQQMYKCARGAASSLFSET